MCLFSACRRDTSNGLVSSLCSSWICSQRDARESLCRSTWRTPARQDSQQQLDDCPHPHTACTRHLMSVDSVRKAGCLFVSGQSQRFASNIPTLVAAASCTWLHTHKKASPVLERLWLENLFKEKRVPNQFDIASQLFKRRLKTSFRPSDHLQTPKSVRNTLFIPKGHKVCTTQN